MNPAFDLRSELLSRNNPLQKFGFGVLLVYFFVAYSRVLDILAPSLHLPMLMAAVMYATTLAVGGIQRSLTTKPGILFFGLTGLMCFSILFTPWKGSGVETLTSWMKTFPLYLAVMATVYTTRQVQNASNIVGFALTITCIITVYRGETMSDGRLIMAASKFGDPNDLALFCNLALTSWFSLWSRTESRLKKLFMLPCIGIILVAFVKTGSRGGLIGLGVVFLYVFWRSSPIRKMLLVGGALAGLTVLGLVAGQKMKERFLTFFDTEKTADDATVGSTESRLYLLRKSVEVTLLNPVIGVGPGNFMYAENQLAVAAGANHGAWHQTHNMYTQVSSELGIPGFLMYLGIMGLTWMALARVEKRLSRGHPDPAGVQKTAFWLKAMFLAFASSGTFLSIAYQDVLPLLASLAIVLERSVIAESFLAKKEPQQPSPVPARKRNIPARAPAFAVNRATSAGIQRV